MVVGFVWLMLLSAGSFSAYGQYEPQFTHYMFNHLNLNPAYSGSVEQGELSLIHRSQWVKLSDQPISTQNLGFSLPLFRMNSGIGLNFVNDFIGYQRSTYMNISYAYRIAIGKNNSLSLGLSAGFIQSSLDGSKLRAPEGLYDGPFSHNDLILPETQEGGFTPDFSFGIYLKGQQYYAGVAVQHLLTPALSINSGSTTTKLDYSRIYNSLVGYKLKLSPKVNVPLSLLMKTDFIETQMEFSALFEFSNNIWVGGAFRGYSSRSLESTSLIFGFNLKRKFKVSYSYDIGISSTRSFHNGTHELFIGYNFPVSKPTKTGRIIYNPRFI